MTATDLDRAKRDVHMTIESLARALHDAVEKATTPLALLLLTQLIAALALDLERRCETPLKNAVDARALADSIVGGTKDGIH